MKTILWPVVAAAAWLIATTLDLIILTILVYATGHWLLHLW